MQRNMWKGVKIREVRYLSTIMPVGNHDRYSWTMDLDNAFLFKTYDDAESALYAIKSMYEIYVYLGVYEDILFDQVMQS